MLHVQIKENDAWQNYHLNYLSSLSEKNDISGMKILVNGISSALNKPMRIVWENKQ